MAANLAQLLSDRPQLQTARLEDSVADALRRMLDYDYSQLPVVATDHRLLGLVSTTTIARAALHLGEAPNDFRVRHAYDPNPIVANGSDTLWTTLDRVRDGQPTLIVDEQKRVTGILTAEDFTTYLRQLSEDSLASADIEETVKQLIRGHYENDEAGLLEATIGQVRGVHKSSMGAVRKVVDTYVQLHGGVVNQSKSFDFKKLFDEQFVGEVTGDFDRLTLAQFNAILLEKGCWAFYERAFALPRDAVVKLLDGARELRNQLAHHRGPLTSAQRDRLYYYRDLLSGVADQRPPVGAEPIQSTDIPKPEGPATEAPQDSAAEASRLSLYLSELPKEQERVVLSFSDIRGPGEESLPPLALQHRSWWKNDEESAQASSWLDSGWRVVNVNLNAQTVTFGRNTGRTEAYLSAFNRIFKKLRPWWTEDLPSPAGRSWQTIAKLPAHGPVSAYVNLAFARQDFRVELYIDSGDARTNEASLDAILPLGDQLTALLGVDVDWDPLSGKRACKLSFHYPRPAPDWEDESGFDTLADWVAERAPKFLLFLQQNYKTIPA